MLIFFDSCVYKHGIYILFTIAVYFADKTVRARFKKEIRTAFALRIGTRAAPLCPPRAQRFFKVLYTRLKEVVTLLA